MVKWILALSALAFSWSPLFAQSDDMESAQRMVIYFQPNTAEITPTGKKVINSVIDQFADNPDAEFYLAGHTDTLRLASINLLLSASMANEVASYLKSQGIAEKRIRRAAFGESTLAVKTEDGVGEPLNRRVVINVYVPKGTAK